MFNLVPKPLYNPLHTVLNIHPLIWRPGHTKRTFSIWQHGNHFLNDHFTFVKEAKYLGTFSKSKNKCQHFPDNTLISNAFSLLMEGSRPSIWIPPVPILVRVSVLSFTLKAINPPQDKEFLVETDTRGSKRTVVILKHNDTLQVYNNLVCLIRLFFFS